MKILARGRLARGEAGSDRAALTFPAITSLSSGGLIATLRAGRTKDDDGERIEIYRAGPDGADWTGPHPMLCAPQLDGQRGSLKLCYLTETAPGQLMAAAMWINRSAHPGAPLFNEASDGCLPMAILLAQSRDDGKSWTPWQRVPLPETLGPPSLTAPILRLPDGQLVLSIETNKRYHDAGPWDQRAVFVRSDDGGQSWSAPEVTARDPAGRLFNWDLRCGVLPDGRIVTFAWTYDRQAGVYLDIHRRIVPANGGPATAPEPLGFADQPGRPAMLPDGGIVLPYVDRFGTGRICARIAAAPDAAFGAPLVLHEQRSPNPANSPSDGLLAQMSLWSYGLPWAEPLASGAVLVAWYAGTPEQMDIHVACLSAEEPAPASPQAPR